MRAKRSRSGLGPRPVPAQSGPQPERLAERNQLNRLTCKLANRRKVSYWKRQIDLPIKEIPNERRWMVRFDLRCVIPQAKTRAVSHKKGRSPTIEQTRLQK